MLGSTLTNASPDVIQAIIDSAARNGVPANIALGIAAHESGFNPGAVNVNVNGTKDWGVMQLNDTTVKSLGVNNPLDPLQNIEAGVGLIGQYIRQYSGDVAKALWAYASGPGAVARGNMNSVASGFIDSVTAYDPTNEGYSGAGFSITTSAGDNPQVTNGNDGYGSSVISSVGYAGIAIGAMVVLGVALVLAKRI